MSSPRAGQRSLFEPVRPDWLALRQEPVLEPDLVIVDAHHHLWDRPECPYLLPDLLQDATAGHAVRATVFVECRARYRREAESALRSLGETEFAAASGTECDAASGAVRGCAAIVACVDLRAGEPALDELLDRHVTAAGGRLRGIRNISALPPETIGAAGTPIVPPRDLLTDPVFRAGFAKLALRGLSFDAWMFHTQLPELLSLAEAFPDTKIVLNHLGGPLGIGRYAGRREEVFAQWSAAIRTIAARQNTFVKLGGLGMPLFGFGFHEQPQPPSSAVLAENWRPYIDVCIQEFGPSRCMFESNFPVDKASFSYVILWNAFKRLTRGYSRDEREDLFSRTASRFYRLDDPV